MALTIEKLRQFQKTLEVIKFETDTLIAARDRIALFKNAEDYHIALNAHKHCPQDYYKVRFFDFEVSLSFNHRTNKFYLHLETLNTDFIRSLNFIEFVSKYKLTQNNISEKNYFIPQELKFEECVKLFGEFCILLIQDYISQDKLFYYK